MPVKRNKLGQFEPSPYCEEKKTPYSITEFIPKSWIQKFITVMIVVLMVSPWIFILVRRNSISKLSQTVTDFYDDTFSCQCDLQDTINTVNPKKEIIF